MLLKYFLFHSVLLIALLMLNGCTGLDNHNPSSIDENSINTKGIEIADPEPLEIKKQQQKGNLNIKHHLLILQINYLPDLHQKMKDIQNDNTALLVVELYSSSANKNKELLTKKSIPLKTISAWPAQVNINIDRLDRLNKPDGLGRLESTVKDIQISKDEKDYYIKALVLNSSSSIWGDLNFKLDNKNNNNNNNNKVPLKLMMDKLLNMETK
ncbi:MAG: hypothetical protein HQK51_13800 [Oligoflexia bacterium]|nr:hypothetical protein [Oligoflexia bacterium]